MTYKYNPPYPLYKGGNRSPPFLKGDLGGLLRCHTQMEAVGAVNIPDLFSKGTYQ